jgi:hypothetical protein
MLKNMRGSSLIFVVSLAIILNIVFVTVYMTITATHKTSGAKKSNASVLLLAEAGKENGKALLRSGSYTPVSGTGQSMLTNVSFGGGNYSVRCSSNVAIDTIYLKSTGVLGNASSAIEVTCTYAGCSAPTDSAYNYGLVAGGTISWSGSGSCNTGSARLHCNNSFTMSGSSNFICSILSSSVRISMSGSGNINGSVWTPLISKSGSGAITGSTTLGAVPNVAIPVIDLTPYYNYALKNGQVFSGKTITGSTNVTVPGGVMWVNGTFNYSGSGNVSGSIIATGNVSISGSGSFTASSTYPAIVSRDGSITMSGSGRVTGLVYSRIGDITKSGSGDVVGSIICGGNMSKSGSWSTLTYVKSVPVPPECSGIQLVEIGWKEIHL